MSLDVKALREGYDIVGMEVLVGPLQSEQEFVVQNLLVVGSGPQSERMNDFQRGKYAAYQEVIETIQEILKP